MPPKRPPARSAQSQSTTRSSQDAIPQAEAGASQAIEYISLQDESSSTLATSPAAGSGTAPPKIDAAQSAAVTATRGRGGATARAIARPRGIGRRSQQGRDQLEKAEADRRAAEAEAHARESAWRQRQSVGRGRGSMRGKTRGGYAGENDSRKRDAVGLVSGPFSLGEVSRRDGARSAPSGVRSGARGAGASSTTGNGAASSSRVKHEPGAISDVHIKQEDGGYVSSDGEDEADGPKMNVDKLIDLTGDDEEAQDAYLPPVRIQRVEHKERMLVGNADKSTKDKPAATEPPEIRATTLDKRKGKQKAVEVEITEERHRYRGTYTDSESDGDVPIKAEPGTATSIPAPETIQSPPTSPEARRKAKERIKSGADAQKPSFQTKEEELEWDIRERDLRVLRNELRQLSLPPAAMVDADQAQAESDPRADKMYLFQLPAILPELIMDVPKTEDNDIDMADVPEVGSGDSKATKKAVLRKPTASGMVGKLRVHESGKAYLDWGGIPMEISMGQEANFLQDVLILDQSEDKSTMDVDGQNKQQPGLATSMGQVKGKFIAVPDWDRIFEEAY